jgi:hypothetical protein
MLSLKVIPIQIKDFSNQKEIGIEIKLIELHKLREKKEIL